MASWILVPCLDRLRDAFNAVAPARDHTSDGTIADALHSSSSDHTPDEISDALRGRDSDSTNEVHALDVDADLRTPGLSMEIVVQHLLARCRAGAERRLRYIIYNRRIWEASNGWRQVAYTGPNPHDKHAHFSSSYDTAREASTASWHLEDIPMTVTTEDLDKIGGVVRAELTRFGTVDPLATILARSGEQRTRMTALITSVAELDDDEWTPDEIEALAGKLAEKLPAGQAKLLADELAARLVA
jgi:hypothetical protein